MTLAEFDRFVDSQKRIQKRKAEERASYDYILGDLIGRSIARVYSPSNKYPEIYEAYPNIFKREEVEDIKQEQTMKLSALRLQQFAESFNKKLSTKKEGNAVENE